MIFHRFPSRLGLIVVMRLVAGCGSGDVAVPDAGETQRSDGSSSPDVDTAGSLLAQLAQARATWEAAKTSCPTYHYFAEHQYFPFGDCDVTAVEISQDRPTQRRHGTVDGCGVDSIGDVQWDGADTGAIAALTVEQMFDQCNGLLSSHDPATNMLLLVVGSMGVPSTCGYAPKNCADDCFTGFDIVGFACGPLPADPIDGGQDTD